jgi:hypothetical protein
VVVNLNLQVYVYEDADYEKTLELIDSTSEYALTGAMYVPADPSVNPTDTFAVSPLTAMP